MKKILVALLTLCCLLPVFAACGKGEEAPDNMQQAAVASAPFSLYVPTDWLLTTESGISGARVNSTEDKANVTVTAYYPDAPLSPADYFETVCLPDYTAYFTDFARLTALDGDTTLGGKDAKCYVFTYTMDGHVYQVKQIIVAKDDKLYTLTYTAFSAHYNDHTDEVEQIRANFVFR